MDFKFLTRTLVVAMAGSALAIPVLAQWQWTDKEGRKVYSDRPPPPDIPQKNILREPGVQVPNPAQGASAVKASMPKLPGKDAELEARKKQANALEESKKQEEAQKIAKARADNCEQAKRGQATLKSGVRIALINAKGEREFMDDADRMVETKRLQAIAESDCAK